jgi:hypothetical protein
MEQSHSWKAIVSSPIYICNNWYVLYVLVDCRRDNTYLLLYLYIVTPDDGQLASPKYVEVVTE